MLSRAEQLNPHRNSVKKSTILSLTMKQHGACAGTMLSLSLQYLLMEEFVLVQVRLSTGHGPHLKHFHSHCVKNKMGREDALTKL